MLADGDDNDMVIVGGTDEEDEKSSHDKSNNEWDAYFSNLDDFCPFVDDGRAYRERVEGLSHLLFSEKIETQFVDAKAENGYAANGQMLKGSQEVISRLHRPLPSLRIISIARKHSLLNFRISCEVLLKILTRHKVNVSFLDLLLGLRASEEISEKGFGLWSGVLTPSGSYEICYQLRYVELVEVAQERRWPERQLGVYHSFSPFDDKKPSILMLLHARPNSRVQTRISEIFANGQYHPTSASSPLLLHVLLLYTYFDNWRWYLDDLGAMSLRMENEAFTAELSSKEDRSLSFRTLQQLRNLESKFLTTIAILNAMLVTVNRLQEIGTVIRTKEGSSVAGNPNHDSKDRTNKEMQNLAVLAQRCESYINSVKIMQNRVGKLIDLLADGLNQKGQSAVAAISTSLLDLTRRSVDDNATVRVVTVITLIYLPTQFVATFFGTNFVVFQTGTNTIRFATDFWIFIAVSVPLTLLTLGIWLSTSRKEKNEKLRRTEVLEQKEKLEDA